MFRFRPAMGLMVLALLTMPGHASASGPGAKGFRLHRQHALADGSVVAFTDLTSNAQADSQAGGFREDKTFLLDAARFGRWVIALHVSGSVRDASGKGFEETYDFTYVPTGEHLRVARTAAGTPDQPMYCVNFGDQALTAGPQRGENTSGAFVSAIQDRASEAFKKGLKFIGSLSLTTEPFDRLSPAFSVIWGQPPAQGTVPPVPYELVPVDCSFDASFGYPCDAQERPARADGRIYVKPAR
jgi:hypothetical protein